MWKVDWAEKRFYPEMFNSGIELESEGCCGILPCDDRLLHKILQSASCSSLLNGCKLI